MEPEVVVAVLLVIVGIIIGAFGMQNTYQKEAIQKGYALYCPDTGEFAWKGECEK